MKWAEIVVRTTQEATEAVAHIFETVGATGVIIEDPQLVEQYRNSGCWDYCDLPVSEDTSVRVIGYLPMLSHLADTLQEIRRRVDQLDEYGLDKGSGEITWTNVAEEDWATGWKKYYHPVRVGHSLVIKPSWEEFAAEPQDLIIELDPGMAFGTGTHATTTLCMEAIETYLIPGMSVVDVGTGSGVLAIAAAKLGAGSVLAIDLDPVAVKAAQENVVMNDAQSLVRVLHGDLLQKVTEPADMVVANIIANVIIGMAADVPTIMKPQGLFIASGIIDERLAEVKEAIVRAQLHILSAQQKNGWSVVIARKE